MKLKAKQIFYSLEVEKELKKQAIEKDMSLSEYITHLLTKQAGSLANAVASIKLPNVAKLLIGFALLATLTSCSDRLFNCPAYSSIPKHRR